MRELDTLIASFGALALGAYLVYVYRYKRIQMNTPTVSGPTGWGGPEYMTYNVRPAGLPMSGSTLFPLTNYPAGVMT